MYTADSGDWDYGYTGRPRSLPPFVLITQFLIESHVTERQDEETRGTGDPDVHHVHTGGARLAARRIIAAASMVRTCDNIIIPSPANLYNVRILQSDYVTRRFHILVVRCSCST